MIYRIADLKYKDVINIRNGNSLGHVCDIEFESEKALVIAVIVRERFRLACLFTKPEECVIPWKDVKVIGDDAILVGFDPWHDHRRPRRPKPDDYCEDD